jgi:hypothetical protein
MFTFDARLTNFVGEWFIEIRCPRSRVEDASRQCEYRASIALESDRWLETLMSDSMMGGHLTWHQHQFVKENDSALAY